jgi:hypothetical protein
MQNSTPLATGASTSANQTNASQKTQVVDGSGNIISSTNVGGKQGMDINMVGGDIEIGAVELKNGTDDTRATVTSANQLKVFDNVANSLTPAQYDYILNTYTGSNITTVVYKTGGAGGATVSTLNMTYDGSDNLLTVTKT